MGILKEFEDEVTGSVIGYHEIMILSIKLDLGADFAVHSWPSQTKRDENKEPIAKNWFVFPAGTFTRQNLGNKEIVEFLYDWLLLQEPFLGGTIVP